MTVNDLTCAFDCIIRYIPEKEYPGYNFMGLIIGPRGNTHRKMEQETGCKISIRGRGSVKEGKARRQGEGGDDDDDLHVLILGSDPVQLDKAEQMVAELLEPVEDGVNEHKQRQLRELALINGTLREEEYCSICGEKGHRQYECPNRNAHVVSANVRCAVCGETSHITADCPLSKQGDSAQMDREYLNFISELDGKPPAANTGQPTKTEATGPSSSLKAASAPRRPGLGYTAPVKNTAPVRIENPLLKEEVKDPITGRVLKPWERPINRAPQIALPSTGTNPPVPSGPPPPPPPGDVNQPPLPPGPPVPVPVPAPQWGAGFPPAFGAVPPGAFPVPPAYPQYYGHPPHMGYLPPGMGHPGQAPPPPR